MGAGMDTESLTDGRESHMVRERRVALERGAEYKLPIGERGRQGSVYDWGKIQAAYLEGYPARWGSVRGFAKREGLPVGLVANRADREKWVEGLELAGKAKHKKNGLERVARNLDIAEKAFGLAVKKATAMLKGQLSPQEFDKVVRALKESYISLRLSAEKPTSITTNREFAFLWFVEPPPYADDAPRRTAGSDEPLAVDGQGSEGDEAVYGGERGKKDTQDRFGVEVVVGETDSGEAGVKGVVSSPDIPTGEDGCVAAVAGNDSRPHENLEERAGVESGTAGEKVHRVEGVRQL